MKIIVALVLGLAVAARAQGPLTPPGAPAPGMKTLAQIEPRIAITSAPVTLSVPGSYYFATNLMGTVTLATNDITVDMMGFSIGTTSYPAFTMNTPFRNILIRNGVVAAPATYGFDFSVSLSNANGVIEGIRIRDAGSHGILVGSGFEVRDCEVTGCSWAGVCAFGASVIRDCRLTGNGYGIYLSGSGALVENNVVQGNADNYFLAANNQLNLLLCEIPESLDWPCSVKLAGTLRCAVTATNGIAVNADDVTIDLAGHALIGPGSSSGSGIYQGPSRRNLAVRNGSVTHWQGTGQGGLYLDGANLLVGRVEARTNYVGIRLNQGGSAERCVAVDNRNDGIVANRAIALNNCAAYSNANTGIYAAYANSLQNCLSHKNGNYGIYAVYGNALQNCAAYENIDHGIAATDGNTMLNCVSRYNAANGYSVRSKNAIRECLAQDNSSDGISVASDNAIVANTCIDNSGIGIGSTGSDNRIEGNSMTDNNQGLNVMAVGNFVARNTCSGNATNWVVAIGNVCLVVQASTNSVAISGNAGGTAPGSTDPNANFTF